MTDTTRTRLISSITPEDPAPPLSTRPPSLIFLVGPKNSGKTRSLIAWNEAWMEAGLRVAGVISHGVQEQGVKTGFDLVTLPDHVRHPIVRTTPFTTDLRHCGWHFDADGFRHVTDTVLAAADADVMILDEIGPLELAQHGGLYDILVHMLRFTRTPLVVAVRPGCLHDVVDLCLGHVTPVEADGPGTGEA